MIPLSTLGAATPRNALWTPASLSVPPAIWLNYLSGVTDAGGGACSQWSDRTANAAHFTQGTSGNRPSIQAAVLNGRRVIRGDGGTDFLSSSVSAAKSVFSGMRFGYLFIVWQRTVSTGGGTSRVLANFGTSSSNNSRLQLLCDTATNANKLTCIVRRELSDTLAPLVSASNVNSGPQMALVYVNWGTREGRLYVNGELEAQNLTLLDSAGATNGSAANANPTIFASLAGTAHLDGDIAEVVVGSTSASSTTIADAEVDKIFGYGAYIYGLQGLLDVSHPYKSSPP